MFNRSSLVATCGAVILGLVLAASGDAQGNVNRTTYLTFNRSVALPGITLTAGTYIFELADPGRSLNMVQVLSRDRATTYLTTLTLSIPRPRSMPADRQVTFGEAPVGAPAPIKAWFPLGDPLGHEFVYPTN